MNEDIIIKFKKELELFRQRKINTNKINEILKSIKKNK